MEEFMIDSREKKQITCCGLKMEKSKKKLSEIRVINKMAKASGDDECKRSNCASQWN